MQGDQVEVQKANKLASDSREQTQAVERPAREELQKLGMEEEERPVRKEQERVAYEELEKAAREEEETPAMEGNIKITVCAGDEQTDRCSPCLADEAGRKRDRAERLCTGRALAKMV
ncbi:hypothetical protein OIDMADRAFT_26198 [Oidiodendron maius Zn]|uniref:Uncharacterized protein n=1 Tax=Oidiodendron maius (strain Zn) TaxID=913774 RepID=A0A0C3DNA0_OIDMZ|nr:hypothetical protein OIDMADRAFT_26198 [Oidiodendron maius Zn]